MMTLLAPFFLQILHERARENPEVRATYPP